MSRLLMRETSADRFDYWWNNRGTQMDEINQRRGGESLVERVDCGGELFYCKRQRGHLFRSLRYPLGRPTVLCEAVALSACRRLNIPVPEIQFSGVRYGHGEWLGLLVTRGLTGYLHLDEWFAEDHPRDPEVDTLVLRKAAELLVQFHRGRWQHSSLYPKHLFVKALPADSGIEVNVLLLDLEKSRQRVRSLAAARHDLQQLHRQWERIPAEHWQVLVDHYLSLVSSGRRRALVPDSLTSPGWATG
jgi:hypothetical protein